MTRVLIADDQEMVRAGLRQMLERDPELEVVGEAADGASTIALALELRPDVCTVDVRMPNGSGLEVTRRLLETDDPPAIVIVTTFDLDEYLFEALSAGASGFVLKDASAAILLGAVHAAAKGESLISPGPTTRLIERYIASPPRPTAALDLLTEREIDVLRLVCTGMSNDDIAAELHIASSTTKGHVASLLRKTGSHNRVGLVIWAFTNTAIGR